MSAAHAPTPSSRRHVELLTAAGIQQTAIAGLLGISVPTLKAHYGEELSFGKEKMLGQVAVTLFQQAVGRAAEFNDAGEKVRSEIKPNLTAAIFIMKCQGGWKETHVFEHVDPTAGATDRLNSAINRVLASFDGDGRAEAAPAADPDQGRPH